MYSAADNKSIDERAEHLFVDDRLNLFKRIDKLFLILLYFEWALATVIALALSPQTWEGAQASVHFHVLEAFLFGGALISLPTLAVISRSGQVLTRHVLAIAQMLMCGLLIQFTDGRIESHFSIFGSLAFLAFYRDWKVLITASLVVALDHFFRGVFWPQSIFGSVTASPWRTVEHTAWVVFEDLFLIPACVQNTQEMRDIASRQALIEAAHATMQKDNAAKMHALVNGAVDGIITIDEQGSIESLNKAFVRMFGYSGKELLDTNVSSLLDDKFDLQSLLQSSKKQAVSPIEIYMKPRVGNLLPVELSISEVHLNDRPFYTVIIRDISERKEVELRVSEFYSIISHELRTPLTSIRGAMGLIEGGIVGAVSPDVLELVTIARSCSDRLIRLINDILDVGKIEAGKIELRLDQTTLSEIIEKTVSGINGYSLEKNVAVTIVTDFDVDMTVDSDRIIQVITNLLSNAIKFSEAGQTVDLKVVRQDPDQIKISVIDRGIGIEDSDSKLFMKFQQIDSSDSRKSEGTGLGLAISKALVEFHGGKIGVDSKKGVGSEFWFTLPLRPLEISDGTADIVHDQQPADGLTIPLPPSPILKESYLAGDDFNTAAKEKSLRPTTGHDNDGATTGSGTSATKKKKSEKEAHGKKTKGDKTGPNKTGTDGDLGSESEVSETGGQLESDACSGDACSLEQSSEANAPSVTAAGNVPAGGDPPSGDMPDDGKPRLSVLIIEDDDDTRKIVGSQLRSINLDCIEANNGESGMELANSCRPDLIVLDLGLPRFDGFELVSMLRSESVGNTALLVYTGRDLNSHERSLLSLGATRHLTKSTCSMNEFLASVKELLMIETTTARIEINTQNY